MDKLGECWFNIKSISEIDARKSNPQMLAFVGDAVFSLYIRHLVVLKYDLKPNELHSKTTEFVKASGQSNFVEKLLPILSENEKDVFRRARNYKTANIAKNAKVTDYKRATGLEALIGYLYLSGNTERINEILSLLSEV